MLNEVLKMIAPDIKTNVKQEIKELGSFSKLEMQCKTGLNFSINLGWHSMHLDIVR